MQYTIYINQVAAWELFGNQITKEDLFVFAWARSWIKISRSPRVVRTTDGWTQLPFSKYNPDMPYFQLTGIQFDGCIRKLCEFGILDKEIELRDYFKLGKNASAMDPK